MIRNGLLAVTTVAALGVAGCGSSNKALSYSEFGQKADAICKKASDETDPVSNKITGQAKTDAPLYDQVLPKLADAAKQFKALKPPEELRAAADQFASVSTEADDNLKQAQTAAKAGDQTAYRAALEKAQALAREGKEAGSKIGAPKCAT